MHRVGECVDRPGVQDHDVPLDRRHADDVQPAGELLDQTAPGVDLSMDRAEGRVVAADVVGVPLPGATATNNGSETANASPPPTPTS